MVRQAGIGRLALGQIAYLLGVIVFGAYVRASGSGAGCGSHWPLCNGEVIPTGPAVQTIIEYTHRLTSGLTLPLAALVYGLTRRAFPQGHRVRRAAFLTIVFLITEGLIGAGVVHFEHVAGNRSLYRAFSMGLHLVNTFALAAMAALTWYWTREPEAPHASQPRALVILLASGLGALVLVGVSGAIAALGDTLFPVSQVGEAWRLSFSGTEHLFVRLRIYHPFIAMAVAAHLIFVARQASQRVPQARFAALVLTGLLATQLCLGYLNVYLFAPIWLQLVHLLTAELIWMVYVVFAAHTLLRSGGEEASGDRARWVAVRAQSSTQSPVAATE